MAEAIRDGWHQVITVFPAALTTVAYRYESGGWWVPDPRFNEASLVGADVTPLYTQAEVDELIERASKSDGAKPKCSRCGGTRTVNLGTNSDAEYHPCPVCKGATATEANK